MKDRQKIYWWLMLLFIGVCGLPHPHLAVGEAVGLSVKAELPENQLVENAGYYDLRVKPNDQQELSLLLFNSSEKEITVKLTTHAASTGSTGAIDYSQTLEKRDDTLKIALPDILTVEETVKIPAQSEKKTLMKLAVPAEGFDGIVLGAVRVTQIEEEETETSGGSGMVINNKYAYSIGVKLSETDTAVKGELALKSVSADQITGRNTVFAHLQNNQPTIIEKVSYHARVYVKGGKEVLHENKATNYRIAPNSSYIFPISWENQEYKAGEYTLHMIASTESTSQKWEWTQAFSITKEEAKRLNEEAVDLETDYRLYILLAVVGISLVIVGLVVLLVVNNRRNKRKLAEARSKSRKRNRKSTHSSSSKSSSQTKKTRKSSK